MSLLGLCRRYQNPTSLGNTGDTSVIRATGGPGEVRAHLCGMDEIPLEAKWCLALKCIILVKSTLNGITRSKYWLQLSLAPLRQQRQLDFETLNLDLDTLCSSRYIREVSEA